jgi:hypothetical protein
MVQNQAQEEFNNSSSNPRAAMRRNFLASMFSMPVAGHPEEHNPHVRQRLRLPPSGSSSMTLSLNVLSFFFLMTIGSAGMIGSFIIKFQVLSFNFLRSHAVGGNEVAPSE